MSEPKTVAVILWMPDGRLLRDDLMQREPPVGTIEMPYYSGFLQFRTADFHLKATLPGVAHYELASEPPDGFCWRVEGTHLALQRIDHEDRSLDGEGWKR